MVRWIEEARGLADLVLVSLHAHEQRGSKEVPAEFIAAFAREMIDAGADLVVGHGPHLLRGLELYKGKPIFYSPRQLHRPERAGGQDPGRRLRALPRRARSDAGAGLSEAHQGDQGGLPGRPALLGVGRAHVLTKAGRTGADTALDRADADLARLEGRPPPSRPPRLAEMAEEAPFSTASPSSRSRSAPSSATRRGRFGWLRYYPHFSGWTGLQPELAAAQADGLADRLFLTAGFPQLSA